MAKLLLVIVLFYIIAIYSGLCDEWEVVGSVTKGHLYVTASTNYLWSVNSAHEIYKCMQPCKEKWERVAGALMQVDASDAEVWGVNKDHAIFKRTVDGSGEWKNIGGRLKHVSASGNGYMCGVNSGDHIYKCKKPCTGQWKNVGGRLKQIDGGYAHVYEVNRHGQVFSAPIDGSKGWRHIPSSVAVNHVTASGNNELFAISRQGDTYRCKMPCIGEWEKMSTNCNKLT